MIQTLSEILSNTPEAPTETIGVRQVNVFNIDTEDSYNSISANSNTLTIKCNATGRELTIDFSGEQPIFSIVGG